MGDVVRKLHQRFEDMRRMVLADMISLCTQKQRDLFHKAYPEGVPAECLDSAIDLCERTIQKKLANPK
jgi:hypothetical protein